LSFLIYIVPVNEIRKTPTFDLWLGRLRDKHAQYRIEARIYRLALGLTGDAKPVGHGVAELRIDCGPGYRIYFTRRGQALIILLAGGDKSTQDKDIRIAIKLASHL